jgi:hypothetical protein
MSGPAFDERDGPVAAFPESYIESGYEQHCLGRQIRAARMLAGATYDRMLR